MTLRQLPKADLPAKTGAEPNLPESALGRWNPALAAADDDDARSISILDPIGSGFFYEGVTAKRIAAALRGMGKGPVTVNINSPGGDFFEGLAIYNLLREHDGAVTVKILGIAASAASSIAMAGDEILIARAGFVMIHNTHVGAYGDRHAHLEVSDWLAPFDTALVDIYAVRTGTDAKALGAMLDKETWIGGAAAVEKGFADDLLAADQVATKDDDQSKAQSAYAKMDALMASLKIPRSERRAMFADLKGGTQNAAPGGMPGATEHGTQDAAVEQGLKSLLEKLDT